MRRLLQFGLALNLLIALLSVLLIFLDGWRLGLIGPVILFSLFAFFCWQRLRQLGRSEA